MVYVSSCRHTLKPRIYFERHHMKKTLLSAMTIIMAFAVGCKSGPDAAATADSIYYGGSIVTVNDAQPTAEAVAVKDGKILMVGSRSEIEKAHKGEATTMIDLAGKTLVPGFIDPHSHYINSLSVANQVNVYAPPSGPAKDIPSIVAAIKQFRDERHIPKEK
jgi:predicted amidohydrolase YtcJ